MVEKHLDLQKREKARSRIAIENGRRNTVGEGANSAVGPHCCRFILDLGALLANPSQRNNTDGVYK